ncbi:hypothetical protein LTR84_005899 [Exophiala bonariae]|uniref:Uncharacterized protein n=1 Tax=Exophiala bonariae TaxID=1690606 RepID=A0AAV9N5L0_9EURO|nr:hypothetical protein LTR84_005899 [Exophiala bonariae]
MADYSYPNILSRPSTASTLVNKISRPAGYRPQHQHEDSESTLHGEDVQFNFSTKFEQNDIDTSYHSPEIIVDERTIARLSRQPPPGQYGGVTSRPTSASSIWLPFLLVLIPNIACPAVLLGLIFVYRFQPQDDIFAQYRSITQQFPGYILVTISATRLAIISSIASTLAPFLTSFIMGVWKVHVVGKIRRQSRTMGNSESSVSDTPQLSLLISLLAASMGGLVSYLRDCRPWFFGGRSNQKRQTITRQIHSSASIFSLSILLVISMFIADTIFHTYTDAVSILEVRPSSTTTPLGHRLIDKCENFDRSQNLCLPCTWDAFGSTTEFQQLTNSVYQVRTNISQTSQIQSVGSGLSILLPSAARLPNATEYRAKTIGVSTQCQPITKSCNPILTTDAYTQFNCSDSFRGIINKAPVKPENSSFTIADPDTPPLNLKPSAYLQLGMFEDSALSTPYNPVNYNTSSEGWAMAFGTSSSSACPSDASLLSTMHVGVAGRFDLTSTRVDVDLLNDTGLFSTGATPYYMDFMFGCTVSAVEVEYIWAENTVCSTISTAVNGSLLDMYVGQLQYYTNSPGNDWTNDILQMALQDDSAAMADTWANLFGNRVLSVIGGYSVLSDSLAQQTRRDALVAKVPVGPLAFLVACSAAYSMLVLIIAVDGWRVARRDPGVYGYAKELDFTTQLGKSLGRSETDFSANASGSGLTSRADAARHNPVADLHHVYGHERSYAGSKESIPAATSLNHGGGGGGDESSILRHASQRNNGSMPAWI